jgi:threonine dehydrogenase-like Zn-dependent dehydrogenase
MMEARTSVDTMAALVWTAPLQAELREQPVPEPAAGEVVLAVRAVGVCGSDLHGYRGHSPLRVPPLVLGHEVVGEDPDGGLHIVNPLIGCGTCALCGSGQPNLCPERALLGLNRAGAFAEYVAVPEANLHVLPVVMSPVLGTLVEPLATGVNALRGTAIGEDTVVVVIGAGPIGLLAAHAIRRQGPGLLIHHDLDPRRVAYAAVTADLAETSIDAVFEAVARAGDGQGAAVVVDAVGVEATWTAAIGLVRPGGTVLEVGLGQPTGELPVGDLVRRGITVRGVYAYTSDDFADALALLTAHPPALDWVQTAELGDGVSMLARLADGTGPVKAVFVP